MREIKFKIYDKNDTKCIIGPFNWNKLPQFLYPDNFTLLQFTGLKDKNSVEIYEGDIVKSEDVFIGEVKWCNSWNCFKLKRKYPSGDYSNGVFLNPNVLGNVEVVGNIFENPELLKE